MNAIKYFFPLLLLLTIGASGQSLLPCGKVQSGSLSIPSYKFIVVVKNGRQFEKLHAVGFVEMETHVWGHSYGDWNWETENRLLPIPVTFVRNEGVYISKAIASLEIKDTGSRQYPCLDRLRRFFIGFTLGNKFSETTGYAAGYGLSLWDKKLDEITFQDHREPVKITLKSWGGKKEPSAERHPYDIRSTNISASGIA